MRPLPTTVLLCLLAAVLFPPPCPAASRVTRQEAVQEGLPVSAVLLDAAVAIRLRSDWGPYARAERAAIVARRMAEFLEDGVLGLVEPERDGAGAVVLRCGGRHLVTVDAPGAALGGFEPWALALAWSNNIRAALGVPALASGGYLTGVASWYGPGFHGRLTANGEVYDQHGLTAAHRFLPFGTVLQVTCLATSRAVIVRINDRGPFIVGRHLDLSYGAAMALRMVDRGLTQVRMTLLRPH